jgi:antirestriction protein ArdC
LTAAALDDAARAGEAPHEEEPNMKAQDLFEKVTADLITAIEDGASGWRMPWHCLASGTPTSVDGRPYRGWNTMVLAMVAADRGWPSNRWATYRAWQRHGCQVRRGERGTRVVLWKPTERPRAEESDEKAQSSRSLIARVYTVFAAEQADGSDRFVPQPAEVDSEARVADAEAYFASVGARVVIGGDRACYAPTLDEIRLPALSQFEHPSAAYATAAHEHIHWTGHESRLGRDLSGRFGDHAYGAEELIAELGAAFWCAQFGLMPATRDDHAAYLGDWLAMLRADARALVAACGHAQRAVDYLNQTAAWIPPVDQEADVA